MTYLSLFTSPTFAEAMKLRPNNTVVVIIITISNSTVLVSTLAISHRNFRNLFRHLLELLRKKDQPVAKASTYTEQLSRKTRTNIHALSGTRTHGLSAQAIKANTSDRAATGTGSDTVKQRNYFYGCSITNVKQTATWGSSEQRSVTPSNHPLLRRIVLR
jgi:hypothetical protein